jgi:hypothetical protein
VKRRAPLGDAGVAKRPCPSLRRSDPVDGKVGLLVQPRTATALFGAYHSATPIALYVAGLALVSLIAAAGLPSIVPSRTDDADVTPSDARPVGGVPATEPAG